MGGVCRDHTQALLGKYMEAVTSTGVTVERWKEDCKDVLNPVYMPSLSEVVAETSGVLESISVAEVTETFMMAGLLRWMRFGQTC